jgi:hypothetical protein
MKKLILSLLATNTFLFSGIPITGEYLSPSSQIVKRESWERIEKEVKRLGITEDLIPFFESIAEKEEWGHLGYHGANQGFRVYQDVIRLVVEEILQIPVREDFHFLRAPGDPELNLYNLTEFSRYHGKDNVDNKTDERAKQLLSMNFAIWSNFDHSGSFSLYLFVDNFSKTSIDYSKELIPFFKALGIPKEELHALFNVGRQFLNEDGGILLQLSESSHLNDPLGEAYNFADEQLYPCKRGGYQYGSYPISNHYERIFTDLYLEHKLDCAPQLRLLINNKNTLNPYSFLTIRRYDLYPEDLIKSYEDSLREKVKKLPFDPDKATKCREKLLDLWL